LLSCLRFFLILTLLLLPGFAIQVQAAPNILYVSATNPTCSGMSPCYTTIQAAVDAALNGDEIRIAAGTYTGSQNRTGADTYNYKQVVFIDKSLTLRGGYHPATWAGPDPAANPTIIDAGDDGRPVTVLGSGTQDVVIEGLILQNGDYTGLGNGTGVANQACKITESDCGGGLFVRSARITLKDSILRDNIGTRTRTSHGGGAFFWEILPDSRVVNTRFTGNSLQGIQGYGAAISVFQGASNLVIEHSTFTQNQTNGTGGGLFLYQNAGTVKLEDCTISDNTAEEYAGGLYLGVTFEGLAYQIERVTLLNNHTVNDGSAIEIEKFGGNASSVKMENIIIASNTLTSTSSTAGAFYIAGGSGAQMDVELKHLTFANHPGKAALHLLQYYARPLNIDLTNILVDNAFNAIAADENTGPLVIHDDYTLVHNVNTVYYTISGTPEFQTTHPLAGDPKLTNTFHLGSGSAAIDAGTDAGVLEDIDGDPRPLGGGFDIGADEFRPSIFIPFVQKD
jgi:hypothetical protein